MKIKVQLVTDYHETLIYIMRFDDVFMYFFSHNKELFSHHVILPKAPLYKRIALKLGIIKALYNNDEIDQIEKVVLSGAMKSLDTLKGGNFGPVEDKTKNSNPPQKKVPFNH